MKRRLIAFAFAAGALAWAAPDFHTGAAARAVIGQKSFSSRESGLVASAISLANNRLYVAESSGRLLTFDVGKLPVLGLKPVSSTQQSVLPSTSTVSLWGKTLAAIDLSAHRVLIWRSVSAPSAAAGPDLILTSPEIVDPISVVYDGKHLFVGDAARHAVLVWKSLPASEPKAPDAVLGNAEPGRADSIERPNALASDGSRLFVADSQARRILVFSEANVALSRDAVRNAASLQSGPLAPGTLISIAAPGLADASDAAPADGSAALPLRLGGVQVFLDGAPLPLASVSPDEIRAQLPYGSEDVLSRSLYVQCTRPDKQIANSDPVAVAIAPASPGLFAFAGKEPRPGMVMHGLDEAGPVTADNPAHASEVLRLWATGLHVAGVSDLRAGEPFRGEQPAVSPVTAYLNGQMAEVESVTVPTTSIGIFEIRLRVPDGITAGNAVVQIAEDGLSSNSITVPLTP